MAKQEYTTPEVKDLGSVVDLTKTGNTQPGSDDKGGSASSQGG